MACFTPACCYFSTLKVILVVAVVAPRIVGVHGHRRPVRVHKQVRGIGGLVRVVMRIVVVLGMVLGSPAVVDIRSAAVH